MVLDIRVPSIPVTELHGHTAAINACAWAPHSSGHMCTVGMLLEMKVLSGGAVGDDSQALVWDLSRMDKYIREPILSYSTSSEINQLSWSKTHSDWLAIASNDTVEILRV